jgi:SAM-dependent methyltransferase
MEQENEIISAYTVVFDHLVHLGPGDSATTRNIAERLRSDLPSEPRVADFGCGVGASALVLAQTLPKAHVLALDSHAPFVARLESTADAHGLGERISAVVGDMKEPPPLEGVTGEFDLIWSESSIYSIGRTNAFSCWRPLLKPGGWLVFSDIVWQREPAERSDKVSAFWAEEYPDITTADAVVDELITAGFKPAHPVFSDRESWSNYYEPLRERLEVLTKREDHPQALIDLVVELEREISVFDCMGDEVALSFFFARRDSIPE